VPNTDGLYRTGCCTDHLYGADGNERTGTGCIASTAPSLMREEWCRMRPERPYRTGCCTDHLYGADGNERDGYGLCRIYRAALTLREEWCRMRRNGLVSHRLLHRYPYGADGNERDGHGLSSHLPRRHLHLYGRNGAEGDGTAYRAPVVAPITCTAPMVMDATGTDVSHHRAGTYLYGRNVRTRPGRCIAPVVAPITCTAPMVPDGNGGCIDASG
jgi:hypothetical protein